MRDLLRARVFAEMVGKTARKSGSLADRGAPFRARLTQGWSDIKGFLLTREANDEISAKWT